MNVFDCYRVFFSHPRDYQYSELKLSHSSYAVFVFSHIFFYCLQNKLKERYKFTSTQDLRVLSMIIMSRKKNE